MFTRLIALAALMLAPIPALAAPPPPSFSILDAVAGHGKLCFPINKHGRINSLPSTVTFYIIAGTAKPPADYTDPGRVTVSFGSAAGSKLQCISVTAGTVTKTLTGKIAAGTNARLYDGTAIGTIPAGTVTPPPPPPDVTCPDGSVHPAGYVCPTPPPPPTGSWALKSLWSGATHARAKMDCSSVYRTAETDRVGTVYPGVKAGTVYLLVPGPYRAWGWQGPFKNIDGQYGASWLLENPAGGIPIWVAETCLEGVVPA
jgi:hypothetical protein